MVDLLLLAIPFFLLGIAGEAVIGRALKRRIHRGPDVFADLSLGVLQTLLGVVAGGVLVFAYAKLYEHTRLFTLPMDHWASWAGVIVGVDFFYYWFHRAGHRVNIAWASHTPHHSSEDYNLAVALRQGPLQPLVSRWFYLPLALVGFPLEMMLTSLSINTIYQFWVHTELVQRFPRPIEWIMNTPSHHRVHHGCNGAYLDRNYGGILIVWDRVFGTFEPERDRPVYGTVRQLTTWNPLWATVEPLIAIAREARQARRWVDKIAIWFAPPEWRPTGVAPLDKPDVVARPRFEARPPKSSGRYVTVMFVVLLAIVVGFLFVGAARLSVGGQWAVTAWIVVSLGSLGALLDGRAWAPRMEVVRWVAAVVIIGAVVAGR